MLDLALAVNRAGRLVELSRRYNRLRSTIDRAAALNDLSEASFFDGGATRTRTDLVWQARLPGDQGCHNKVKVIADPADRGMARAQGCELSDVTQEQG